MAGGTPHAVADFIHQLTLRQASANTPDEELLRRFIASGDATAFELLLWRHERMVMGVCRRVLRDIHDAEDAFQATFLVLARKARSISASRAVTTWLHTVAYHVALNALKERNRRLARVGSLPDGMDFSASEETVRSELSGLLDEAVNSLPEKYRAPVVFCYLEGRSHAEAARAIGCATGTVSSRLARAKERLRAYLGRRGVNITAGVVAAGLGGASAAAVSARAVVPITLQAAKAMLAGAGMPSSGIISAKIAALTQGVLKAMLISKLKIATAVMLGVSVITISAGLFGYHVFAADKPSAQNAESSPRLQDEKAKQALQSLPSAAETAPKKQDVKKELEDLRASLKSLKEDILRDVKRMEENNHETQQEVADQLRKSTENNKEQQKKIAKLLKDWAAGNERKIGQLVNGMEEGIQKRGEEAEEQLRALVETNKGIKERIVARLKTLKALNKTIEEKEKP